MGDADARDTRWMRVALRLAARADGFTSPNPLVGALIVRGEHVLGRGWHRRAGLPHAEVEALRDAQKRGPPVRGATLYVNLEPCCTHGRTPPCTDAIIDAGLRRVVVGTVDPNPAHAGRGLEQLRRAGIEVVTGVLASEATRLNEPFHHWIVHGTPFVTVKAAMTLDGKIATASGESKWITSERARAVAMKLRQRADAILVGLNTVLADDPRLTVRALRGSGVVVPKTNLRRIVLDSRARTPLSSRLVSDPSAALTTIVVTRTAPPSRVRALRARVKVLVAPSREGRVDLRWLLRQLGGQEVTSLLVEGGGEVNASFLLSGLAQRIAFFYAPKIIGGHDAPRGVAGTGVTRLSQALRLREINWRRLGPDWWLSARVD